MTTYRIGTVEANGSSDFDTVSILLGQDPKEEYLKLRLIQSVKGFKRPMPKSISIES